MTAPFIPQGDPVQEYLAAKAAKEAADADPVAAYLAAKGRRPATRGIAAESTRVRPSSENDDPGVFTKALGVLTSTGRDIPGAEAAQAIARATVRHGGWQDLVKHLPDGANGIANGIASVMGSPAYRTSRDEIRGAEDAAPKILTIPARIAGGALAAATIPGGPALQGARFGILQGLAQSDPDVGLKDRLHDAAVGGAVGGATGGIANNASRIPFGRLAKAAMHPRTAAVKAIGGVIRDALGEARAPVASEVAEAVVPSVDGFIGNGMDNVMDAVRASKAQPASSRPAGILRLIKQQQQESPQQGLYDAYSREAQAVNEALDPPAAPWKPRGRTKAQFEYFADRMAKRPPGT